MKRDEELSIVRKIKSLDLCEFQLELILSFLIQSLLVVMMHVEETTDRVDLPQPARPVGKANNMTCKGAIVDI